MLSNETIIEIQRSVNIVDVIGEYLSLQKKGNNYLAVCPFHDDHSPSMSISEEKQIYNCFVCHNSGNVFRFIMNYENVSFIEAVKIVAEKSGIKIDANIKNHEVANHEYYECMDFATKYYQNNLKTEEGREALEYLIKRGITEDIIEEFQIGYAPNDNALVSILEQKGFNDEILVGTGLCNVETNIYTIFRNRITFPIHNSNGKPVSFSARIYKDENSSKYINTKETKIFKKGLILFNYSRAIIEAKKKKEIILVEGQMDAIRIFASGIKNVVATMGTALTKEHIKLLSKLNVTVILSLDSDKAGEDATLKNGELLKNANIEVKVLRLSDAKDPDEYILKYGITKYIDAINHAIPYFDYRINILKSKIDTKKTEDVSKYINSVINELNKVNDEILTDLTINKLSEEFKIDKNILYNKIINVKNTVKIDKKSPKKLKNDEKIASLMVYYMMNDVRYIKAYENDIKSIPLEKYDLIASDLLAFYLKYNYINIADFISFSLNSDNYKDVLEVIDTNVDVCLSDEEFIGIMNKIKSWIYSSKIEQLKIKLANEVDINKKVKITDEIAKLKKRMCDL